MSEPKKHHYVPQFFMKPWFLKGNPLCYNTETEKEFHPSTTKKLGLENNLYTFREFEIESGFISKYIDGPLHKSVEEVVKKTNKWDNLSDKVKTDFLKFLILLDARHPQSIVSMLNANESIPNKLDFSNLPSKYVALLEDFLEDDMCIFICIVIHELELDKIEETKNKDFVATLKFIQSYLAGLNETNQLFPNFLSCFLKNDVICVEILSEEDVFVTSSSPVRRMGSYDKKFLVVLNLSPNKSIIFSNCQKMVDSVTNNNHKEIINNINTLNISELSKAMPVPKIIIFP